MSCTSTPLSRICHLNPRSDLATGVFLHIEKEADRVTYDILQDVQDTKLHLGVMMAKERLSGEFLLASVVQDSLLYNLHQYADSLDLIDVAHHAAKVAVQTSVEEMGQNEFCLCEAIRGVMHSMVSLGGEPATMTVAVSTGGMAGVYAAAGDVSTSGRAIVIGICSAVEDMGIDAQRVRPVAEHVVRHFRAGDGVEAVRIPG